MCRKVSTNLSAFGVADSHLIVRASGYDGLGSADIRQTRDTHPMRATNSAWLIAVLFSLTCCQRPTEASESLVGAANLPPVGQLTLETISINRTAGADRGLLEFELLPDDTLTVTHYEDAPPGEVVRAQESFRLAADAADRARRTLWRVRPADLKGVEWLTFPLGCSDSLHQAVEVTIAFVSPDERVGAFVLPEHCESTESNAARNLVRQVIRSFPSSEVAAQFPPAT